MDNLDQEFLDERLASIEAVIRDEIRLGVRAVVEAMYVVNCSGWSVEGIIEEVYGPEDSPDDARVTDCGRPWLDVLITGDWAKVTCKQCQATRNVQGKNWKRSRERKAAKDDR